MFSIMLFLSSGLFLGWSLGANDAANVWGTAVGTKMVRFKSAAIICSVFVILGAVISGSGASHTLGKLGAISTLPGAFTVALAANGLVYAFYRAEIRQARANLTNLVSMAAIRQKLRTAHIPASLRGLGITFITTGLIAMAFMTFSGIQL